MSGILLIYAIFIGYLIRCLYVFSYILFLQVSEITSAFLADNLLQSLVFSMKRLIFLPDTGNILFS